MSLDTLNVMSEMLLMKLQFVVTTDTFLQETGDTWL